MAKTTKRSAKQQKEAGPKSSSTDANSPKIPKDFTKIPQSLESFAKHLSTNQFYIVHLDTNPKERKRQIFILPTVLNLVIIFVIIWRIYVGVYTYPDIIAAMLGRNNAVRIDTSTSSWGHISVVVVKRTFTFLFDYLLIALFLPWPIRFITGPTQWRRKLGFRPAEIVVRQSRSWSEGKTLEVSTTLDSDILKTKIVPAIHPTRLQKTGYLLIDPDWDLDFSAMLKAHELVDTKSLRLADFEACVLMYGGSETGWVIWRIEDEGQGGSSAERKALSQDKLTDIRAKLVAMGKEELFFRWVELMQYVLNTQAENLTGEDQDKALGEIRALFSSHGVEFDKFWEEVGGLEGMPTST
ncbi:hypothetical protein AJ80_00896 [Polytolypa hystricis UAMH7299]|uniref:Uncharacterized protein n=1 Tax=Polytolypa hystricis (strain UAMH7299) TaxID=1447883 RepID=A0A2B7Z2S0_POLH7|nr:hypothetical protein AJ80_00896 [Polytolypa hystricis UAMH7299]